MFEFALIIGIYSYLVFFLGAFGFLHNDILLSVTLGYFILVLVYLIKIKRVHEYKFKKPRIEKLSKLLFGLLLVQALVNLIGVLGPELSFDALWYHLTLPKLFLDNNSIFHIPGGLLYYSDMPKSIEMLYIPAISLTGEILAKLIHFGFGLGSIIGIYKLSRIFLNSKLSLIACVIFYSNLVVGWLSITSYIDFGWAFFEILALYYFALWFKKKDLRFLVYSSIMLGFSLSSKIVAFNSLAIFTMLIGYVAILNKESLRKFIKDILSFLTIAIMIPLPWFIFSYMNTGNPFYPLFEKSFNLSFKHNIQEVLILFTNASDPISPIYLIFIPLILVFYKKMDIILRIILLYSFLAIVFWFLFSQIGGSRFIIPYLAAFSALSASTLLFIKNRLLTNYLIFVVIVVSIISILYRGAANMKYIPVILGSESKHEFLTQNLNFSFGDFYDTDNYFKNNIKSQDKVLLFGFHNLYYVEFSFIDSSFVKRGDKFNYIATQNTTLPERFSNWKEVYYNSLTNVRLYSMKGELWAY